jgi:hypothetical protein
MARLMRHIPAAFRYGLENTIIEFHLEWYSKIIDCVLI